MKRLKSQEGFTLIELVIIILVLGILAATAIPKFYDLSEEAKISAEKGVVGGVRGGIAIVYASNLINHVASSAAWPSDLGGAVDVASSTNKLFSSVISPGIDADWERIAGNKFIGPANHTFTYSSTAGTFE